MSEVEFRHFHENKNEEEDEGSDEEGSTEEDSAEPEEEEVKEVPKWDSFQDNPFESQSFSMAESGFIEATIQIIKLLSYLVTFGVVLVGAALSKSILLLMTSQLAPDRVVTVLKGSVFLIMKLPNEEKYLWIWALLICFSVPELGTLIRSVRIALFKGFISEDENLETTFRYKTVGLKYIFAVVFVMETLHVIGLAIFVFEVLPQLDVARGVMLTNCLCIVPALLSMLSKSQICQSKVVTITANALAFLFQITGLFTWPLVMGVNNLRFWLLPFSLIFMSCGWWINYVSEESPIGFVKFLARIKDTLKERNIFLYKIYIGISIWKILIFFGTSHLILAIQGVDILDFFTKTIEAFSEREMMATQVDIIQRVLTDTTLPVQSIGTGVWWIIGAQVFFAYCCYIFGKFACRVMIQPFSFALPCALVVPVTIVLIVVTTGLRNENPAVFKDFLPDYLFFNSPQIYDVQEFFIKEHAWVWILWVVSQVWITFHIWLPRCERLSKTEKIFATPMYSGFLVDQSMAMNRRRDEIEIREKTSKGGSPHIITCATMWHEVVPEMLEMLKSLLRLDNDQCLKLKAKSKVKDPEAEANFYTLECHIFFDDAFELDENTRRTVLNSYVKDFLGVIKKATIDIYGEYENWLKPPLKYSTPYGGRLEYTLPGANKLYVHLKDKDKIRHKKRWSQVMYMYYLLGFKLMELPISEEEKIERKENTYILALDGDIDFKPDAVLLLVDLMKKNKSLGAACGRIHPVGSGFMAWYQLFEYAIGHWLQKATEHMIGCVLCSPGCFSLFRAKALMSPNVMKRYTTKAEEARHYVQYDQGEDRWLCTLLLQRGYRVEYSAASDAFTHCPETFDEFYLQRRRWIPSTIANIIDLLNDYKQTVRMNNDISMPYIAYQMLLLAGTVLGPGTILLMMVGAFNAAFKIDNWTAMYCNLIPIGIFILLCLFTSGKFQLSAALLISLIYGLIMMAVLIGIVMEIKDDGVLSPTSLFLFITAGEIIIAAILHPQEVFCLLSGVVYYVTIPSMYLFLIIYSVCNLNVVSWGTREAPKKKTKADLEDEQKEAEKKAESRKIFGILDQFSGKEETGALEFSLSNIFKCICCTSEKQNPANEQYVKIGETLDILNKKMDEIGRSIEGETVVRNSIRRATLNNSENSSIGPQLEDQRVLVKGAKDEDEEEIRNDLFNPYWAEDRELKNSKFEVLSTNEIEFWNKLVGKYLYPLKPDKDKEEKISKKLKELRDKMVVTFFMLNAMFVISIFLLQVNKDQIYIKWPLGAKANITFNSVTYEITIQKTYLQLEPIGLAFVSFFASIMIIQFVAMLFHRFETLSHLISNTPLTILRKKKALSYREKLEYARKTFNKQNQQNMKEENKPTTPEDKPWTIVEQPSEKRKSKLVHVNDMYDNIFKQMNEDEERRSAERKERRRSSMIPWRRSTFQDRSSKGNVFMNLGKIDEEHFG